MSVKEKPYWWPAVVDDEYIAKLREDYDDVPEDDDGLREHFDIVGKYADVWDHLGDARSDWEPLADAFLDMVEAAQPFLCPGVVQAPRDGLVKVRWADVQRLRELIEGWDE